MKSPVPLLIMLFSLACVYRGFVAFFPALRGENRKRRKPIPKRHGVVYFLMGLLGFLYSLYVMYIFTGGTLKILPVGDKTLFRTADAALIVFFVAPFALRIISGKKKDEAD